MKSKFIVALISMLLLSLNSVFANYTLQMHLKSGKMQAFKIAEHPILTVENSELQVKTATQDFAWSLSEIEHYDFISDTKITDLRSGSIGYEFIVEGDYVSVSGLVQNEVLNLYSASGVLLTNVVATDGTVSISLSNLSKGVYILSVGSSSTKIIKK